MQECSDVLFYKITMWYGKLRHHRKELCCRRAIYCFDVSAFCSTEKSNVGFVIRALTGLQFSGKHKPIGGKHKPIGVSYRWSIVSTA